MTPYPYFCHFNSFQFFGRNIFKPLISFSPTHRLVPHNLHYFVGYCHCNCALLKFHLGPLEENRTISLKSEKNQRIIPVSCPFRTIVDDF